MSIVNRFMKQLHVRGLRVIAGDKPGELKLSGNLKEATPEVIAALKKFKPELLRQIWPETQPDGNQESVEPGEPRPTPEPSSTCQVCRSWVNLEMAADVWRMCGQEGWPAKIVRGVQCPAVPPCPYRPRREGYSS